MKFLKACIAGAIFAGASVSAANATTIFTDNFNRSDSNTLGAPAVPVGLTAWSEIENDSSDVAIISPGGSDGRAQLRDENGATGIDAAFFRTISTSGFNSITLSFDWDHLGETESDDFLFAEWRVGGAGAWTSVFTHNLNDSDGFLSSGTIALGAGANNNTTFQLRFRTDVSQESEGALLDNVTLSGTAITAPPASVPEPITLSLFGAGLAGAAAMRRRKAKKA